MRDALQAAFQRAAKVSPLYRGFQLYKLATGGPDNPLNRPIPYTFDWLLNARGTQHWRDVGGMKENEQSEFKEGVVTVLAPYTVFPDLILTESGQWLGVVSAEGSDALGVGYTLIVRRWENGSACHPPIIRNAAP